MKALMRRHPAATVSVAGAAALVTAYSPQLLMDSSQFAHLPLAMRLGWLALVLVAPPLVAFIASLPHRRTSARTWFWVGLPLPVAATLLVWLDVWLEVRSGYLLAGSGEEAMAYGIGTASGLAGGTLLAALVTAATWMGTGAERRGTGVPAYAAATGSRSCGR
jgi:hypothetical protein